MNTMSQCEKKESQIELEMKKLSSVILNLEERIPDLCSRIEPALVSKLPTPTNGLSPDKLQEPLCPLSNDIRGNTSRIKQLVFLVEDILERIRL